MAEEPAVRAAHLLSAALNQITSHAVILLDPQGTVLDWLAGSERILGYTPREIVGQNVSVLFTPEDVQQDLSNWELQNAVATGASEDDRWQLRKDGGRLFVSGTLTALRDEQGKLMGFIKLLRDRTDQKIRFRTLESRVTSLQQVEERKNAFISTLAHELRNPLVAIRYATDGLKAREANSPEIVRLMSMIGREIEFMQRMISDLLDAARISAGKLRLSPEPVVLQDVVVASLATCRPVVEKRNQHLEHVMPDVPIRLVADPLRLQQVIVNLVENAAKYTPQGGNIWVTATIEGSEAVIRVKDTGEGISTDVMPYIFELFTQADASKRSQEGLGIGLAVVRDLITLHGGTVQALSEGAGKGSEFIVRLKVPDRVQQQ